MDLDNMEASFELEALRKELDRLNKENTKLRKVVEDNELIEELDFELSITPEEEICVKGIETILERVRNKTFDSNDIKNYDILHRNLNIIKGISPADSRKKKEKPAKLADLIKIAEGS